jgi:hypothetical protein
VSDSTFNIGGPGAGASGFDKSKHLEHLVSFVNANKETRTGSNGPYEAALCRYVICHTCRVAWAGLAVTGTALVPRLTGADVDAEIVAGVIRQGEQKTAGRTPPFLIDDASGSQLAEVSADFDKYGTKLPSGIVFDVEGFTVAPDDQPPDDEPF